MRARKVRRLAACALSGAVLAACGLAWAQESKADPVGEAAAAVCSSLDRDPTVANVSRMVTVLVEQGLTPSQAGLFIAGSISELCTRNAPVWEAFVDRYAVAVPKAVA
ncbi:hypothetical protein B1R94_02100 [Mycolicibacterium litorale]|nr:hypothetical protein B1R94_02100 [Mycolicibacterium litorale]